jgi:DNA-directed RNA polymerase specialized sigma24 family protein
MSSANSLEQLGEQYHAQLVTGDNPIVTSQITESFLPHLIRLLRSLQYAISDEHLIAIAAEDALLGYFESPARFDPRKGKLFAWLAKCARNNLLDALKKQKNYLLREKSVELEAAETVYQAEAEAEVALVEHNLDTHTMQKLKEILDDQNDLKVVLMMMEGIRETELFAATLGISHLSVEEQRTLVKQHKDRLKKTIQRHYKREKS